MNLAQALELANAQFLPGFYTDDETLSSERRKNEEAIQVLTEAWERAPLGQEPFPFSLVRELADRNREACDEYGSERLRDERGSGLARGLSDDDLVRAVAALQHRSPEEVARQAGPGLKDLGLAYRAAPVSGTVVGIDLETSDRYPARGYILNVGLQVGDIASEKGWDTGYVAYCGIPAMYADKGVPLSDIHHITWDDVAGRQPFRENRKLQEAVLAALTSHPFLAHNAAFEDSWLKLHLDGYAEARKAGRVVPVDTRDICRRLDPEARSLPRETHPAALENWALRRGTLKPGEKERHLGLDDVILMMRTVQAEFKERNML